MATDGVVLLPILATGTSDAAGAITLPSIYAMSAGGTTGDVVLPLFGVSAQIDNAEGNVILPSLLVSATGEVGTLGTANIVLPLFKTKGTGGPAGAAALVLPLFSITGIGGALSTTGGNIVLPSLLLLGAIQNSGFSDLPSTSVGAGYQAWTLNPASKAHTQYDKYLFSGFGMFGTSNMGCGSDGLYLLEGDQDIAEDIAASILWALSDLGMPRTKWVDAAYLNIRADGDLEVWSTADERTRRIYTIDMSLSPEGLHIRRALFTRGLFATVWSIGIKNVGGADFTLSDIEVRAVPHKRRLL